MRKSKGKWVASRRDVWDLDCTLSPIIFAGLVKFKETVINSKYSCVPSLFVKGENVTDEEVKEWHNTIDSMIYAFDKDNMPDIQDYNFKINLEYGEKCTGSTQIFLNCDNEEEKQRYYKDLEEHHKKCEEGRMLFAKYYENLWY